MGSLSLKSEVGPSSELEPLGCLGPLLVAQALLAVASGASWGRLGLLGSLCRLGLL